MLLFVQRLVPYFRSREIFRVGDMEHAAQANIDQDPIFTVIIQKADRCARHDARTGLHASGTPAVIRHIAASKARVHVCLQAP